MSLCVCVYIYILFTYSHIYNKLVLQRKPSRHIQKNKVLYNLVIHKLLIDQGGHNVIFYNQHL